MATQEIELFVGVEATLALVHGLHRTEAPGSQQRADSRRPRPLAHPMKQLAVLEVVAVDELLVGEDVPVGVEDPLRQTGRP